jgi:hypothetical protein
MRRALAVLLALLAAGCHEANNPPEPPDPAAESEYALEDGPVTCEGCGSARMVALGPEVRRYPHASLVARGTVARPVRAGFQLRPITVTKGRALEVTVSFLDTLPAGEYDLILGGVDGVPDALVPRALIVTRAFQPAEPIDPAPGAPGTLRITVTSSGAEPDRGFTLLDTNCPGLGCQATILSAGVPRDLVLASGDYLFRLSDIAPTCSVTGSNPVAVRVVAGQVTTLGFDVRCVASAWVRVSARTTGTDLPAFYGIACIAGSCDLNESPLSAQGSVVLLAGAMSLTFELRGVPSNCTPAGGYQRSVTGIPGDTVEIAFDVACRPLSKVRITTRTTGGAPDGTYLIAEGSGCDDYYSYAPCRYFDIVEPSPLTISVAEGQTSLYLWGVAGNCRVTSPNPVTVNVPPESEIDVTFDVTCVQSGRISVTTRTTGTNLDLAYLLRNEAECDFYYRCSTYEILEPGVAQFDVPSGTARLFLYDVAGNCAVQGENPVTVAVPSGESVQYQFEVACQ